MTGSPYARRRLGARAAAVTPEKEEQVITRYRATGNISQCARETGISRASVRRILDRRGEPPAAPLEIDEQAVLRCYDRTGSAEVTARMQGVTYAEVTAILDRHGVPHSTPGRPPEHSSASRQRAGARARQQREPAPSDLLGPREAAALTGIPETRLLAASRHGHLTGHGSAKAPRYRRDELLKLRDGTPVSRAAGASPGDGPASPGRAASVA